MSHANFLRSIAIESPCSVSWDEMVGNDRVRACEHCQLSVQDLSQMTAAKAYKLVRTSKGRLCLRLHRTPTGEIITRPVYQKLHAISRRTSRIAAGAFTAVMSLSTVAYAQSSAIGSGNGDQSVAPTLVKPVTPGPAGWLTGRAMDEAGAVIPGATVVVTNEQKGDAKTVTTDTEGAYRIWLAGGYTYQTQTTITGFMMLTVKQIVLDPGGETHVDSVLNVADDVVMGVVATRSYTQPLVVAASGDDLETVTQLLRNGENVNQAEEDGISALDLAARNGNYEMVEVLLRAGANVNASGEDGNRVLFWLDNDAEPRLITLLVKYGADVNRTNTNGDTPLLHAAEWNSGELIPMLIAAGANLNAQNNEGNTALMIAAKDGNVEAALALLAAGAVYGTRNAAGEDALMLALQGEHDEVYKLLRAAGAVNPVR